MRIVRDDEGWMLIDRARQRAQQTAGPGAGAGQVAAELGELLAELRPDDIIEFAAWQQAREDESYRYDLWGAAYQINRGCSDDGFDYFRGWLLAQGEQVWRAALADPDSLADHPAVRRAAAEYTSLACEDMLGAAQAAYATVTGGEDGALDEYYQAVGEAPHAKQSEGPAGRDWNFDDEAEVARRLPRLAALFGED